MTDDRIAMSVVIPAYNAERVFGRQLDALAGEASALDSRGAWELVVADNGSTDRTREVVAGYAGRLPIAVVDASARRGPGAARNIGAAAANGNVLVFTDADDIVADGWLQAWLQWSGAAGSLGFAAGPVLHDHLITTRSASDPATPCRAPRQMGLPYASSNNLGVHAELFVRLGGFDESRWTGEDVDLSWRAVRLGAEIECVPARLNVAAERSGRALLRRYFEYGLGDPSLYRDHRELGPARDPWPTLVRTYGGLVARLPLLHDRLRRERWLRQLGRRAGRLVGSARARVWFP